MSDFQGMEDLLQDCLVEATDLLSAVDNKLVDLEKNPHDHNLLNDIFRGFHTIKGGAGFLSAAELVTLCHLTENLFDRLRNGELVVTPEIMDVIMDATAAVRGMFGALERSVLPGPAGEVLLDKLKKAIAGELGVGGGTANAAPVFQPVSAVAPTASVAAETGPDWGSLLSVVTDVPATGSSATASAPSAPPAPEAAVAPTALVLTWSAVWHGAGCALGEQASPGFGRLQSGVPLNPWGQ